MGIMYDPQFQQLEGEFQYNFPQEQRREQPHKENEESTSYCCESNLPQSYGKKSPVYRQMKSFNVPLHLDVRRKKKSFKRLIGKMSRERRSGETTKIKLLRRKSRPFGNNIKYETQYDFEYEYQYPRCCN